MTSAALHRTYPPSASHSRLGPILTSFQYVVTVFSESKGTWNDLKIHKRQDDALARTQKPLCHTSPTLADTTVTQQ